MKLYLYPNDKRYAYRYIVNEDDITKAIHDLGTFKGCDNMTITDLYDNLVATTEGLFLDYLNRDYNFIRNELAKYLMSMDEPSEYIMKEA